MNVYDFMDNGNILDEKLQRFLVSDKKGVTNYIHRTTRADVARKIMKEGFHFTDSFSKTTDEVCIFLFAAMTTV